MKTNAVFMDHKTIKLLQDGGVVLSNRIRGNNPPGGHFARPPGNDWLKRVEALLEAKIKGKRSRIVCFSAPKLPSGSTICGFDLMKFYMAIGSRNQISRLDALASKFWLAAICHEKPDACKPYINE